MNWICSQIGAREHYAIPRVLHRDGKLNCLYTELWGGTMWQAMGSFLGRPMLANRYHKDLSTAMVKSFDFTTVLDSVFGGYLKKNPYDWFLYVGRDFGRSVVESLQRKKGMDWKSVAFFGYDTGFLEPAEWVKSRGGKAIVCQMDPSRFEVELVKQEEQLWPGWTKSPVEVPEAYFERREREWALADLVMVNSEWTKKALVKQGVSADKIEIVPLAYEVSEVERRETKVESLESRRNSSRPSSFDSQRKLRVLFLGQVILRKGIQYLIEAAKILEGEAVQFDVVGPIGITDEALQSAPSNMIFHGAIGRNQAPGIFRNADVFVLPTISDGFALTQIEAMAYGLPVITTLNCGKVVTPQVDGLICKVGEVQELAEAIRSFLKMPERLHVMSAAARLKAAQFGLKLLATNLALVEARLAKPNF